MNMQRFFGCGIDGQMFKAKYESLFEEDQLRLSRVADRLWLTLKLRYEVGFCDDPFAGGSEEYNLRHVELPSVEIYLLCTCIDTLAGKPVYKNFKDWIKEQPDISGLGMEGITRLYSRYEEEYGVGRNLRDLFRNLPSTVNGWLADNIVLRRWRSDQPQATDKQNDDKLMDHLYQYFYTARRNAFTHSSISVPTHMADDIKKPKDSGWVTPASGAYFVLYPDRPNQKWTFSYRLGLDEATILRILICAIALQMLEIELTNELLDVNLRSYSRLDALYAFVSEVRWNSILANSLAEVDYSSMSTRVNSGIPFLRAEASTVMLERYLDNPLESGLQSMTNQYIAEVKYMNSLISDFNETYLLIANDYDRNERLQAIREFLNRLVKTPSYSSVVKWPSKNEMTNLWLVIRDPCYTPNTI